MIDVVKKLKSFANDSDCRLLFINKMMTQPVTKTIGK